MKRALALPLVMPGASSRLSLVERAQVVVEIVETYCAARWWLLRLTFPDAVATARQTRPAEPSVTM